MKKKPENQQKVSIVKIEAYVKENAADISSVGDESKLPNAMDELRVNELSIQGLPYSKKKAQALTEVSLSAISGTFPCWIDQTRKGNRWFNALKKGLN
jgi:hypothetical protein